MLELASIVAGAGTLSLIGVLIWLVKKAFTATDSQLVEIKRSAQLERQLDARGTAVAERDRIITDLQKENRRLARASEAAGRLAEDALLATLENPNAKDGGKNASAAIKAALASLKEAAFEDAHTPAMTPIEHLPPPPSAGGGKTGP